MTIRINVADRRELMELARTIVEVEKAEFPELRQGDESFTCAPSVIGKTKIISDLRNERTAVAQKCLEMYRVDVLGLPVENPPSREQVLVSLAYHQRHELCESIEKNFIETRAVRAIADLNKNDK